MEYLVDALYLFVGAVLGFSTGWFTALIFARQQAKDLNQAIERLERVSGHLTGDLRQEVLALGQDVRNVYGLNVYLVELLADAGHIEPRRDEQGNLVFPVDKRLDTRWEVGTLEAELREQNARLQEELRQARRPWWQRTWQRIWRFITP